MSFGQIEIGNGGWCRYTDALGTTYLRLAAAERGRLAISETYFPPIDSHSMSARLQRLPLTRIEAWANQPDTRELLAHHLGFAGPDLELAASYFGTTFGTARLRKLEPNWVRDMLWSQIPASGVPRPPMASPPKPFEPDEDEIELQLPIPTSRPYGDAFYSAVAEVYARAAARWRGPAQAIAAANSVPVTSVHTWVKEARRRGFLSAGAKGKAG